MNSHERVPQKGNGAIVPPEQAKRLSEVVIKPLHLVEGGSVSYRGKKHRVKALYSDHTADVENMEEKESEGVEVVHHVSQLALEEWKPG